MCHTQQKKNRADAQQQIPAQLGTWRANVTPCVHFLFTHLGKQQYECLGGGEVFHMDVKAWGWRMSLDLST